MNWIMGAILLLIAVTTGAGMIALWRDNWPPRRLWESPLFAYVRRNQSGAAKILAAPLVAWALLFLLLLVMLLFVSGVCLMYVFALLHGEWWQLLTALPKTAGNVVVHLIYPLQMTLFALLTFLLAVGGFQLVFGAVDFLSRFGLRVGEVADLARKLAGLLALTAGLEVVKLLAFSLLAAPAELPRFFARDALPKADPLGAALLAAAMLLALAAWWRKGGKPS